MARRARSEQASDSSGSGNAIDLGGEPEPIVVEPTEIDAAATATDEYSGSASGSIRYNKDGSVRKRRGPNKAKGASTSIPLDVNAIQFGISGIHTMLAMAMFPRNDELQKALQLTERETIILGQNIAAVARHYDVQASQKSVDWFNLIIALASIEGPRLFMVMRNMPKKEKPAVAGSNGFVGTRETPPAPRANGVQPVDQQKHKPSDAEKQALLNELPIRTDMQSG